MGKRTKCTHEPVSKNTLGLICQIDAIGNYAVQQSTNLNVTDLAALMMALARVYQGIDGRLNWIAAYGPHGGPDPDEGRAA